MLFNQCILLLNISNIPKLYVDLSLLHGKDFSTAVGSISSGVFAYCFTILTFNGLNPGRFASWFISELLFSLCEDVGLTSFVHSAGIIGGASCRDLGIEVPQKVARREENNNKTQRYIFRNKRRVREFYGVV